MIRIKSLTVGILTAAVTLNLFAQTTKSSLAPEFSADITFSSGVKNIDDNLTVKEIPGLSSEYQAVVNFNLKGSFSKDSEWGVEKEDGIELKSGVGYEAGLAVDMAKVYAAVNGSSNYSESSDTSHYSLIQPMIDWYEKNQSKYALPADPCGSLAKEGTKWPAKCYGESSERYQFISGSTVEPANDVNWTSEKWADASCLYNDIKYAISSAIDQLYGDSFATGNIDQNEYASFNSDVKRLAELKMKAKREFADVAAGKSSCADLKDAVTTAYIKITNICGAADARIDFTGKKLNVGKMLYSSLAGQSTTGSALELSLKKGLIQGFEASVFAGIAGGEEQIAENYDTTKLDYYEGTSGELAVKGAARYTRYFEKTGSTVQLSAEGIWSDLLEAEENYAFDIAASYAADGFINYSANAEFLMLNWKDRTDDYDDYTGAYSFAAKAAARAFGASLKLEGAYKTDQFSHQKWNVEDRFYGYSLDSDYYIANEKSSAYLKAQIEFNPQYFILYDIVDLSLGAEAFVYDGSIAGKGAFGKVALNAGDLIPLPLTVYAQADYYENSELAEFSDYSTLPDQELMDFTKIRAGISYKPVNNFELSAEYVSEPSYSRRNSERVSSITVNGKISL